MSRWIDGELHGLKMLETWIAARIEELELSSRDTYLAGSYKTYREVQDEIKWRIELIAGNRGA